MAEENAGEFDCVNAVKALQQSEQRLQTIIDNTTAVIFVKDRQGRYTLVNRQFEKLFGYPQQQILGKTLFDLFSREVAEQTWANDRKVLETGQPLEFEEFAEHADGLRTYISVKFPLNDEAGTPYAVCGISTDITERKRAEAGLVEARREAEKANRAKSEFLSRMSHELRTPLNAILGFAQLLEVDVSSDADRESVAHILRAGRHLLELINEVLDISRIEANKLSVLPQTILLNEALGQSVELMRPIARGRNISLTVDENGCGGREIVADRQRLNQVLLNLLSNAIKFNRQGGAVTISCATSENRMRIRITDTGRGITQEQAMRLFHPFERLGADSDGIEGTGLGLALSKRLVELMSGTIGIESAEEVGSTFWIELPLAHTACPLPSPEAASHSSHLI